MTERWLPVNGFENSYSVSDEGRIRSERRFKARGGILTTSVAGDGYRKVSLCARGEKATHRYVHEIVLTAFVGPRPNGMDACHGNGKRDDNRLCNLRWDTRANNHADKRIHGTHLEGESNPQSKLTADAVRTIRAAEGTCQSIGDQFGVGPMQVSRIKNRQNWSHLS